MFRQRLVEPEGRYQYNGSSRWRAIAGLEYRDGTSTGTGRMKSWPRVVAMLRLVRSPQRLLVRRRR